MTTINLISGPRNISTALMYSFAQRTDTVVSDEPFYAVYLLKSGAQHPGGQQVLASMPQSEARVRTDLQALSGNKVLFIKNMAHHMEVLDQPFIPDAIHVFLIRDPYQIISSYAAVISRPVMRDIGIEYQHSLFKHLLSTGREPVVVDSGRLLDNPEAVLSQLCLRCGIPFQERMLRWQSGPKSYDGIWAPYWYANVHRSTGFEKPQRESRTLPEELIPLYESARLHYEKLLPFSLKA